jgi:hypothetical protein
MNGCLRDAGKSSSGPAADLSCGLPLIWNVACFRAFSPQGLLTTFPHRASGTRFWERGWPPFAGDSANKRTTSARNNAFAIAIATR